jgi:hypothetical protein
MPSHLRRGAFEPPPLGHVRPAVWPTTQVQIRAAGLTGHLLGSWPDGRQSQRIDGGKPCPPLAQISRFISSSLTCASQRSRTTDSVRPRS